MPLPERSPRSHASDVIYTFRESDFRLGLGHTEDLKDSLKVGQASRSQNLVTSIATDSRFAESVRTMTKPLALAIFVLASCSTGCLHPARIGPQSVPRDRAAYSSSLSDSWKEETLLNIVKVRYLDLPVFVDVGNVVASYTLAQTASIGATITANGGVGNATGGAVALSNTPTITYTPLTGNAYINGLATPLSPEVLFTAIQNGMPADSVLFSTFISVNGLRNQSVGLEGIMPADRDFHRVRKLMRDIQVSGAVRLYIKELPNKHETRIIALRTKDIPPDHGLDEEYGGASGSSHRGCIPTQSFPGL